MYSKYISLADELGITIPTYLSVHLKLKFLPTNKTKYNVRKRILLQKKAKRMFPKDFVKRSYKYLYVNDGKNVKFLKRG